MVKKGSAHHHHHHHLRLRLRLKPRRVAAPGRAPTVGAVQGVAGGLGHFLTFSALLVPIFKCVLTIGKCRFSPA